MVVIRLARSGTKKKPFYHLSVTDKRNPRDGRFIERVGFYNPIARGEAQRLRVDLDRIDYWESMGAQASPKVKSILAIARKQALEAPAPTDDVEEQPAAETAAENSADTVTEDASEVEETSEVTADASSSDTESSEDSSGDESESEEAEGESESSGDSK